jgi:hypothetical protein
VFSRKNKYGHSAAGKDQYQIHAINPKKISIHESEIVLDDEEVNELSTELLGKYKTAAGASASAADKKMDFKTGDKRFKGIMKATKKQFANDAKPVKESEELEEDISVDINKEYNALKKHDIKTLRGLIRQQNRVIDTSGFKTKDHAISHYLRSKHGNKKVAAAFGLKEDFDIIPEQTELEELSAKTLGSYVKKATVDVAQTSFNSGRKVHEPKEYHKSKQAAKSRIQGVMRAANKLAAPKNESAEPADRALWNQIQESARRQFESFPSIAASGWMVREYAAQGGEWTDPEICEAKSDKLKSACWKGYEALGTKEKDGKQVPNCIPVKSASEK